MRKTLSLPKFSEHQHKSTADCSKSLLRVCHFVLFACSTVLFRRAVPQGLQHAQDMQQAQVQRICLTVQTSSQLSHTNVSLRKVAHDTRLFLLAPAANTRSSDGGTCSSILRVFAQEKAPCAAPLHPPFTRPPLEAAPTAVTMGALGLPA